MTSTTVTTPAALPVTARLPRLESLTGLRWWAAFAVFLHHSVNFAPFPTPLSRVLPFGVSGVTFFFVLSGFVLSWSFFQNDTAGRFYWRRFARIWPLHLAVTLLAVPVFYAAAADPEHSWIKPYDWSTVLLTLVLLHAWATDVTVFFGGNPASWSLSCEMFFYAIFPFLIRPAIRRRVRTLGVIFVLLAVAIWVPWLLLRLELVPAHPDLPALMVRSPLGRLFEFLIGIVVAVAIRKGWRSPIGVRTAIGMTLAVLATLAFWQLQREWWWVARPTTVMNQVTAPVYALLIAAVATRDLNGGRSWLRHRVLVTLGQWSYAFYLVHAVIIYVALYLFGIRSPGWTNAVPTLVVLTVSIGVSGLLYRLVEHPLERRLRGMLKPRPASTPVTTEPATTEPATAQGGPG